MTLSAILLQRCRGLSEGQRAAFEKALSAHSAIAGILIGSYAPQVNGSISIGGIDPQTLHQTTHAISAEYIKEMLE